MSGADARSAVDGTRPDAFEASVATVCVAHGTALDDAAPFAAGLSPPTRIAPGRQEEHLLFFLHPTAAVTPSLGWELQGVVTQVYWATGGSVTAALRRAAAAANRTLTDRNLETDPSQRWYAGLACAVLRRGDLFLLRAGPTWACVLHRGRLTCVSEREDLAPLGIGPAADVRLHHVSAAPGDTLLLASPALRAVGEKRLLRVLEGRDVRAITEGLGPVAPGLDFTALVVRWERAPTLEAARAERALRVYHSERRVSGSELDEERYPADPRKEQKSPVDGVRAAGPDGDFGPEPFLEKVRRVMQPVVASVRRMVVTALGGAACGLGYLWHAGAALGAGLVALGRWVAAAMGVTVRSMLPGVQSPRSRPTNRRPAPKENRTISLVVAIAIPLIVVGLTTLAYVRLAAQSRFESVITRAEEQITLAQAAGVDSEQARAHWEKALQQIEAAAGIQPDEPSARVLQDQVQDALDRIDSVERLALTPLADFGSSNQERRLIRSGQALFVLDSRDGWGARVSLDGEGRGSDPEVALVLVRTGQRVEAKDVGRLIDGAWVGAEGGRRAAALLVLEDDAGLVSYDPAWETEGGAPHLSRVKLSPPLPNTPVAAGSYQGQFYILDTGAELGGQIWRYRPLGDGYPHPPEPYFPLPGRKGLEKAVDMAIDGHIYVLYDDGRVEKFLGGEPVGFEIRGVPEGIGEVTGFAVDPRGGGFVYLADPDNRRVVQLESDGRFAAQLRAEGGFEALEALAVNEAEGRLYVLDGGRLYAGSLP